MIVLNSIESLDSPLPHYVTFEKYKLFRKTKRWMRQLIKKIHPLLKPKRQRQKHKTFITRFLHLNKLLFVLFFAHFLKKAKMSVKISIQYGHKKICRPIAFHCLQDIRMNQFKRDIEKMSVKCLSKMREIRIFE